MRLKPCIEDLVDMTPTEGGRFCDSCNKTIVDLTQKSSAEIHDLYLAHKGELCGIVMPGQLSESKYYHPLKRFAFALLLVFGSSLFSFANGVQLRLDILRSLAERQIEEAQTMHSIKGFVYHNGGVLAGAEITTMIDGKKYRAISGMDGAFRLRIPSTSLKEVSLEIASEGFYSQSKTVSLKGEEIFMGKINLEMNMNSCVKGKIAPVEDPPIEIMKQGEIAIPGGIAPPSAPPVGGGIEPPSDWMEFE